MFYDNTIQSLTGYISRAAISATCKIIFLTAISIFKCISDADAAAPPPPLPMRFAHLNTSGSKPSNQLEQIQMRKMLWAKKGGTATTPFVSASSVAGPKTDSSMAPLVRAPVQKKDILLSNGTKQSYNNWEATNFGDSAANDKFRKLMGIKSGSGTGAPDPGSKKTSSTAMFSAQERHYEQARAITHKAKGLGLGFGKVASQFSNKKTMFDE